ncbi:MAG: SufE family protein [Rhizobiaceae bacterium]|nr:SufE family protein [Rhizobiaceae bacterium]
MDDRLEAIRQDFAFLDEWEERYRYIIDLGAALPPYPDAVRDDAHKVPGCVSQVWLDVVSDARASDGGRDPVLTFKGDSDAHIVRGLVAIVLALYSDRPASAILATDAEAEFRSLGLDEHLTPQRANGLRSMVKRIRQSAEAALATA